VFRFVPFSLVKGSPWSPKVWSSSSMRRTCPKEPPRSFQPVSLQSFHSQPSSPARVPGRKETEVTTKRRNDNRKRRTSFDFDFFSFQFCDRSACPMLRGAFKRYAMFTVDCEWSARSIFLSGADDRDPPRLVFPSLYSIVLRARSNPPSPESDSIE